MTDEFDYIVIGGGSAGSVVASRLSENSNRSVCLLEAGGCNNDLRVKVPFGLTWMIGNPRFDWCFQSEPHPHLDGHRVKVPRGKLLGGSASINSMVYIRGRPSDYDGWAAQGCSGWDWSSVLPWFIRSENNRQLGQHPLHGDSGPLQVADLPSPHRLLHKFVAACEAHDLPFNRDFNGSTQIGAGGYQTTMADGLRCSPADAYLADARSRPNLTIYTNSLVDRFEIDGGRAHAVHFSTSGGVRSLGARTKLILCAGAIGSPAILLRSGIGPAAELMRHGIDVVRNLDGVGRNLHDHPAAGVHFVGGKDGYALSLATLPQNALAPFRFVLSRRGLFASNTVEGGGFACTRSELDEPDIQFHFIPGRVGHEGSQWAWGRGYYGDACVLKPRSRGRLTLKSPDPRADPTIDLNLLSNDEDRQTLVRGIRLVRSIMRHPLMTSGTAREVVPGPDVESDDEMLEYLSKRLGTAYHPVGSCRMGTVDDPRTVVDPSLKLVGLDNVYVADASVMPEIVAGNTNAPTIMIAEKAAETIAKAI